MFSIVRKLTTGSVKNFAIFREPIRISVRYGLNPNITPFKIFIVSSSSADFLLKIKVNFLPLCDIDVMAGWLGPYFSFNCNCILEFEKLVSCCFCYCTSSDFFVVGVQLGNLKFCGSRQQSSNFTPRKKGTK